VRLPKPRGVLSEWLVARLAEPGLTGVAPVPDSWDDESIALWTLHELSFRGFEDADERAEWDPGLLSVRRELEEALEERLRSRWSEAGRGAAPHANGVPEALEALVAEDDGPSLADHVRRHADRDQVLELLRQRSVYHLKESDPSAFVVPRLPVRAKAALMALQFRRYASAQVFAFDFGGSIRCTAIACGGDWQDLGTALSEDAAAVQLQPLARIDDAAERAWAQDWLAGLLAREGVTVDPVARDHLWSALTSLASAPRDERTLTGLSVLLQSTELKRALQPYCLGGPFGRLLDAETEALGSADLQAFATEGLIGSAAAPAVLAYLFHRIEARLDGRPTMILVDEGWLALDDATFGGQLREWLKTLRKKNASVVFATQSLADIDGSSIAPAIVESCPTRVFLPNERAFEPQIAAIYRRFGLNDRQIEIVARAMPKRDYYCQSRRGNRLFALGLGEVALAFTAASSKADHAAIDATLAAHGRDGFAAAWLKGRGLDWAVELLGSSDAVVEAAPPQPFPTEEKETSDDLDALS